MSKLTRFLADNPVFKSFALAGTVICAVPAVCWEIDSFYNQPSEYAAFALIGSIAGVGIFASSKNMTEQLSRLFSDEPPEPASLGRKILTGFIVGAITTPNLPVVLASLVGYRVGGTLVLLGQKVLRHSPQRPTASPQTTQPAQTKVCEPAS